MSFRDQWTRPVQRIRANRLYRTNLAARAELGRLRDEAEGDPSMTLGIYLACEAEIVAHYRNPER